MCGCAWESGGGHRGEAGGVEGTYAYAYANTYTYTYTYTYTCSTEEKPTASKVELCHVYPSATAHTRGRGACGGGGACSGDGDAVWELATSSASPSSTARRELGDLGVGDLGVGDLGVGDLGVGDLGGDLGPSVTWSGARCERISSTCEGTRSPVCTHVCMRLSTRACVHASMYACTHVCMRACMHVPPVDEGRATLTEGGGNVPLGICIYIYMYIYMHTHRGRWQCPARP